jgi:hypothetical protein
MSSTPGKDQPGNEEFGADVKISGAHPGASAPNTGEAAEADTSESTDVPRQTGSLGDLTKDVATSPVPEDSGGMGSPQHDDSRKST